MTKRILLLGKNGQVGWELQRALAPLGELIVHDSCSCNFTDLKILRRTIDNAAPDIIVNAAAYTAVDRAEQEREAAYKINSEAIETIAQCARARDALLIHYSTDYVFDGHKAAPYVETDTTNPLSIYGDSKRRGEIAIINSGCKHLIFRTSWVFAARGNNFAKTMLRLAAQKETLRIVADQWGAPTSAELIADVTAHAIRELVAQRVPGGLYHLAAAGETSWHGYASFVIERARLFGAPLIATTIEPISTQEYPLPAARPANSRLNSTKLQAAFNLILPPWRYHVDRMLTELLESRS